MEHIVIIGNGISGVTAARHIRKLSDKKITIISSETEYFYSRTALMYVYMGHMKFEHTQPYEPHFWKKNRIELKLAYVNKVDFSEQKLFTDKAEVIAYDKLILAVGSTPNKFGWKGQDLIGVQGLYSRQDLENIEKLSIEGIGHGVIVGGGLIGVELAEMLHSRHIPVTFLVRENRFWGNVLPRQEGELISRHIREHGVDFQFEEELEEIVADANGRASKVITKSGKEIEANFVGLTAGVRPNIDFLKGSELKIERGIVIDRKFATNQSNVYAIGDCAQFENPVNGRRPIEQVWYTGRIMGETLARNICGAELEYSPGFWFNSAKFFDIEYQTYGIVLSELQDGQSEFYWEHPDGKICMHFVFNSESKMFVGVNAFGIRLRHDVFDRWLNEGRDINYVLAHLKDANFDPEFYKAYENSVVSQYNSEMSENVRLQSRSWNRILTALKT